MQLALDPAAQKEMRLSAAESRRVDEAFGKIAPRVWLLRDVSQGAGAAEKAKLLASFATELETILQPAQLERLRQLVVRARGWPGVTAPPAGDRLRLTSAQRDAIAGITDKTQRAVAALAASNDETAATNEAIRKLRTEEGTAIQALFTPEQRATLVQLVGGPFDLDQVQPIRFPAPEVKPLDTWIHTRPLKLADLRGKVVAFHFWAFGCINCIHNLPHYAKWHHELAPRGLVVLGMHTPETQAERSVDNLRAKVGEYEIAYPVAFDGQAANWAAWGNSVWPAVYLVDKQGRVRYWWYGELNWQGAEGEKFMRQKIEQLLAE
ncbi:MAG: redoxin domain-containing protein [Pirellulales bacterium]